MYRILDARFTSSNEGIEIRVIATVVCNKKYIPRICGTFNELKGRINTMRNDLNNIDKLAKKKFQNVNPSTSIPEKEVDYFGLEFILYRNALNSMLQEIHGYISILVFVRMEIL